MKIQHYNVMSRENLKFGQFCGLPENFETSHAV